MERLRSRHPISCWQLSPPNNSGFHVIGAVSLQNTIRYWIKWAWNDWNRTKRRLIQSICMWNVSCGWIFIFSFGSYVEKISKDKPKRPSYMRIWFHGQVFWKIHCKWLLDNVENRWFKLAPYFRESCGLRLLTSLIKVWTIIWKRYKQCWPNTYTMP